MTNSVQVTAPTAADYLRQPYMRLVIPQDDGTFHAEIVELPGCIATGSTAGEAYQCLEEVAESWLESALLNHQTIPAAMDQADFSGKMVVRMPRSLHRKATFAAQRENVSLNQFLVSCIAESVGAANRGLSSAVGSILNFQLKTVLQVEVQAKTGQFLPIRAMGRQHAGS